jgi:hypothetical protein
MLASKLCAFIIFIQIPLAIAANECQHLAAKLNVRLKCGSDNPLFEFDHRQFYLVQHETHRFVMLTSPTTDQDAILGLRKRIIRIYDHESRLNISQFALDNNLFNIALYIEQQPAMKKYEVLLQVVRHVRKLAAKLYNQAYIPLSPSNIFVNVHTRQFVFLYAAPKLHDPDQAQISSDEFMIGELVKFSGWLDTVISGEEPNKSVSALRQSKVATLDNRFKQKLDSMKTTKLDYGELLMGLKEILKESLNINASQQSKLLNESEEEYGNQVHDNFMTRVYLLMGFLAIVLLTSAVVIYHYFKSSVARRDNSDFASRVFQMDRNATTIKVSSLRKPDFGEA